MAARSARAARRKKWTPPLAALLEAFDLRPLHSLAAVERGQRILPKLKPPAPPVPVVDQAEAPPLKKLKQPPGLGRMDDGIRFEWLKGGNPHNRRKCHIKGHEADPTRIKCYMNHEHLKK